MEAFLYPIFSVVVNKCVNKAREEEENLMKTYIVAFLSNFTRQHINEVKENH